MSDWIETVSGVQFEFLNPKQDQIRIQDIAHALSMNCRFVGQCRRFYSVAEHSWHIARMLDGTPLEVQMAGLLHDASEAYITDVAKPVKYYLPDYQKMEDNIMSAIAKRFGFEYPLHPAVKNADMLMLSTEAYHLLPSRGDNWPMWKTIKRKVLDEYRPICMTPETARENFLDKYFELANAIRASREVKTNAGTT